MERTGSQPRQVHLRREPVVLHHARALIPHAAPAGVSYGPVQGQSHARVRAHGANEPEVALARYRPQVRRHILAMVRDPAEAEDLTQDTYARAVERIERDPHAALAWLYRIAINVALDRLRCQRPATVPLDDSSTMAADGARVSACNRPASLIETALERSEMSECVQRYLVTLSDDYRVALFLHDMHGLSNPEVARLLGCSLATAKIRVHRARQRLRQALDAACTFEIDERGVLVCKPDP
jgi:RNA polymerase sigma-70 factor, ECF subfamily